MALNKWSHLNAYIGTPHEDQASNVEDLSTTSWKLKNKLDSLNELFRDVPPAALSAGLAMSGFKSVVAARQALIPFIAAFEMIVEEARERHNLAFDALPKLAPVEDAN